MKTDLVNEMDIQQRSSLIHSLKSNDTFMNVLYKEFIETPKKRDFRKYIEKVEHLTIQLKAHDEGKLRDNPIARMDLEVDMLENERKFYSIKESELSESYLTHKLEGTSIYKTIEKIERVLQHVKKVQAPVEPQCKIVINLIDTLDLSIRKTVTNEISSYLDELNEFLLINILSIKDRSLSFNKSDREKHLQYVESWELSKIEFQNFLIEYLKDLPKETQSLQRGKEDPTPEEEKPQLKFYEHFGLDPSAELKKFLKNEIPKHHTRGAKKILTIVKALDGFATEFEFAGFNRSVGAEFGVLYSRQAYANHWNQINDKAVIQMKNYIEHSLKTLRKNTI